MGLDPERLVAAFVSTMGTTAMAVVAIVALIFAEPPPTRRRILKAVAEALVGVPMACLCGYAFGMSVANGINNAVAALPLHVSLGLDHIAGGLLVGLCVLKVAPLLPDLAAAALGKAKEKFT